ncbi:MAG: beta-lactamase regulator AmpE [Colwellia sp.]|nr:beta-lactamase regulator AmpE [Colwellia sp.]
MSLISLLIALAAERYLSSPFWQFKTYYQRYLSLLQNLNLLEKSWQGVVGVLALLLAPVFVIYFILMLIDDSFLHLILSTVVLIICFGSFATRDTYKNYLMAAFRGELTTCQLHHSQLMQDKNLPEMGFGQTLIWLNYRYYIAIMMFFIFFGAPGVVFYRLLTTLIEKQVVDKNAEVFIEKEQNINTAEDNTAEQNDEAEVKSDELPTTMDSDVYSHFKALLFWLDWLPVRLTSFGYMLVGHFSKALPVWLESFFEIKKPADQVLGDVAKKSEDMMIDEQDCTAEPCLLVRLAKRNLLLLLAVVAVLTLVGFIS